MQLDAVPLHAGPSDAVPKDGVALDVLQLDTVPTKDCLQDAVPKDAGHNPVPSDAEFEKHSSEDHEVHMQGESGEVIREGQKQLHFKN